MVIAPFGLADAKMCFGDRARDGWKCGTLNPKVPILLFALLTKSGACRCAVAQYAV
jgi:hypothetical protein